MQNKTILVIDKDSKAVSTITSTLEPKGYSVFSASSADVGLIMAKKMNPSLIFVNLATPGTNGLEICKRIHGIDYLKDVPIILLTLREGKLNPQYRTLYGIVGFLKKPLNPEEIILKTNLLLTPDTEETIQTEQPEPEAEQEQTLQPDETEQKTEEPSSEPVEKEPETGEEPPAETTEAPPETEEETLIEPKEALSEAEKKTLDKAIEALSDTEKESPAESTEETPETEKQEEEKEEEKEEEEKEEEEFETVLKKETEEDSTPPVEIENPDFVQKKKTTKMTLPIAATAVVVIALIVFFYTFTGKSKKENIPAQPAIAPEETVLPALPEKPKAETEALLPEETPQPAEPEKQTQESKDTTALQKKSYYIQFGVFRSEKNAKALAGKLNNEGLEVSILKSTLKGKTVYRVLLTDEFDSKQTALKKAAQIKRTKRLDTAVFSLDS
jgi:DNA-binding response OmpR family regulator/cell division protein FtsN